MELMKNTAGKLHFFKKKKQSVDLQVNQISSTVGIFPGYPTV